ncbi:MAG: TolC family protein [Bradymonadales bacterium]|jgi:outer membrane protein TolC
MFDKVTTIISFAVFCICLFLPCTNSAAPLTLEEAYALAQSNSPQIKAQDYSVQAAQAQLSEARYYWAPKFKLNSMFGPMPKEKDIDSSIDDIWSNITGEWGFTTRNYLEFWMPLFTSLKVYNTRQLAEIGLDVEKIRVQGERLKVDYDVARAFYGLQLANAGEDVIKEALQLVDRLQNEYDKLMQAGSSSVKETDQYRIELAKAKLEQIKNEIYASKVYAMQALGVHTGLPQPIEVSEMDFQLEELKLIEQEEAVALARQHRTELKLLHKAELAALKQAKIQWLQWFPDLVLAGEVYYKYSNAVPKLSEKNFFLNDNYNGAGFFAGFVLRWELDPVSQVFKVRRADALAQRAISQRQLAIAGIELEVVKQYQDTAAALQKVEIVKNARRAAKRFMSQEFVDYDAGQGKANDVVAAITAYIELRSAYLHALHDFRLALLKLKLTCGAAQSADLLQAE